MRKLTQNRRNNGYNQMKFKKFRASNLRRRRELAHIIRIDFCLMFFDDYNRCLIRIGTDYMQVLALFNIIIIMRITYLV